MNLMTLLIIGLGIACVLLLRASKSGQAWAKPAAALCAITVIGLAGVKISTAPGPKKAGEILAIYEGYQTICGEVLADSIAERHPGSKVTILTPPNGASQGNKALLESLQSTLERQGLIVSSHSFKIPEDMRENIKQQSDQVPEAMRGEFVSMMLGDYTSWFNLELLNQTLLDLNSQADLVVCGIPLDYTLTNSLDGLPGKGKAPGLILLQMDLEDSDWLLENTVLDTIVAHKGGNTWRAEPKMIEGKQEAFDSRYKLITAK